jgi:hypothetical protein
MLLLLQCLFRATLLRLCLHGVDDFCCEERFGLAIAIFQRLIAAPSKLVYWRGNFEPSQALWEYWRCNFCPTPEFKIPCPPVGFFCPSLEVGLDRNHPAWTSRWRYQSETEINSGTRYTLSLLVILDEIFKRYNMNLFAKYHAFFEKRFVVDRFRCTFEEGHFRIHE